MTLGTDCPWVISQVNRVSKTTSFFGGGGAGPLHQGALHRQFHPGHQSSRCATVWTNLLSGSKPDIQLFHLSCGRPRICPRRRAKTENHDRALLQIMSVPNKISEFPQFYSEKNGALGAKKNSVDRSGPFDRQRELMSSEGALSRHWTAPPSDGWPLPDPL